MIGRIQSGAWMFLTALRTEQKMMRGNPLLLVNAGMLPVVFLVITVETSRPGPQRAVELVSAVILTALWGSTVWMSGGVLRRERSFGTLARCVSGVHSPYLVLLGKSLGATLYSVAGILVSTTAAVLALRIPVRLHHPLWIAAGLVLMTASAMALGALVSCLFLVTRNGIIWSGALLYPVFTLGGLLIPPSAVPEWLHWVPALLSLSWVHTFVTTAATGTVVLRPLLIAAALTVAYLVIAGLAYRRSVHRSRREGSLDYS